MNWQPISTAPKDGRPILLRGGEWVDDLDGPFKIAVARWHIDRLRRAEGRGYWLVAANEDGFSVTVYDEPTEWADLAQIE